jgi:phospholipid/cholesterol/gamma-HCH transport system substrate-binding protein
MSETRRNFMVGLFMVAGLGALGYLLVLFGEAPSWLGRAEWVIKIRLDDISGVEQGTPIYLNGIKVGRVTTLDFVDMSAPNQGIEIVGQIRNQFKVPQGSTAQCVGPALGLGRGKIDIFAHGAGEPLPDGGIISGVTVNPLDKILPDTLVDSVEDTVINIGQFAEKLTPVAEDLHVLLRETPLPEPGAEGEPTPAGNLYTAIQRFDALLVALEQVVGDPRVKNGLVESIENIRQMTAEGKDAFANFRESGATLKISVGRLTESAETSMHKLDQEVRRIGDATMPILEDGARFAANLRLISDRLEAGEGTLGKLLSDERFYEVLLISMERAREAIDSIRRLMARFERSGRIGLNVGGVPVDREVPNPR